MSYSTSPIAERLKQAGTAINGALGDPDILAALTLRSYDETALNEGLALHTAAQALRTQTSQEYGDQYAATDAVQAQRDALHERYMTDLELARVAFEGDREAAAALRLNGPRERTLGAWLDQVRQFYGTLDDDPDLQATIAPLGVDEAAVDAALTEVAALEDAVQAQASAIGTAQDVAAQRRQAMADLDAWMRRYRRVARIALSENPQWLEKLGFLARS